MTDKDFLTLAERRALDISGELADAFKQVIGHGETSKEDFAEVVLHIHALQNMLLAQAAGRAYPEKYRLMGE